MANYKSFNLGDFLRKKFAHPLTKIPRYANATESIINFQKQKKNNVVALGYIKV